MSVASPHDAYPVSHHCGPRGHLHRPGPHPVGTVTTHSVAGTDTSLRIAASELRAATAANAISVRTREGGGWRVWRHAEHDHARLVAELARAAGRSHGSA